MEKRESHRLRRAGFICDHNNGPNTALKFGQGGEGASTRALGRRGLTSHLFARIDRGVRIFASIRDATMGPQRASCCKPSVRGRASSVWQAYCINRHKPHERKRRLHRVQRLQRVVVA